MAKDDPNFEAVYVDGGWGVLTGLIYKPFKTGTWPKVMHDNFYGLDFGFNHPIALIGCGEYDGDIYVTEHVYKSGLITSELITIMDELKISKTDIIYADEAEPDRIKEIKDAGYNIVGCYKGKGSVMAGIDFIKKLNIYTKPGNDNLDAENESYTWRTTKDGTPMDEPIKIDDDGMDAMRYAIYSHLGHPAAQPFSFDRAEIGF